MTQQRFWSPQIRQLSAYTPGEQPQQDDWIKLNTNESPYPPSALALQRMAEQCDARLRLYPDPRSTTLRDEWMSSSFTTAARADESGSWAASTKPYEFEMSV